MPNRDDHLGLNYRPHAELEEKVKDDFNRAAQGEQPDKGQDKPGLDLNREPSQAELQKGAEYDQAAGNRERFERINAKYQQEHQGHSRNRDQGLEL